MTLKKRTSQRFDSLNLISYECMDENNNIIQQGIGRTINLSETGILLETQALMELNTLIVMSAGLKDELIEIKGKIVHCKKADNKKFEIGVHFLEKDQTVKRIIKEYLLAIG